MEIFRKWNESNGREMETKKKKSTKKAMDILNKYAVFVSKEYGCSELNKIECVLRYAIHSFTRSWWRCVEREKVDHKIWAGFVVAYFFRSSSSVWLSHLCTIFFLRFCCVYKRRPLSAKRNGSSLTKSEKVAKAKPATV